MSLSGVNQPNVLKKDSYWDASLSDAKAVSNFGKHNGLAILDNITWTLVNPVRPRARSFGIPIDDVRVDSRNDMTAAPEGTSPSLRRIRNWSDYGVSTSRAMGHWIGRATGAVFGLGIGGITGLVQYQREREYQTIQTSLSKISEAALTGLRTGADTGDWVGGRVAQFLVNIATFGAPKVIDYLDRSFNGE